MKTFPLLASAALAATSAHSSAAVLYSDTFDTLDDSAGTSVRPLSDGNWAGHYGNATTPATTASHGSGLYRSGVVKNTNGNLPNQVSNYLFAQNQASGVAMNYFLTTTVTLAEGGGTQPIGFSPSDYTSLTATWNRNGNTVASYSMAVQVDSIWYVSQTTFTNTFSNTFDLLASTWTDVNVVTGGGGNLTLGTNVFSYADLFGEGEQITGIGFFISNLAAGANTIRIDDIRITGIPEASSSLLVMLGTVAMLGTRKRI